MTDLLCFARTERTLRPLTFRAVTSFAVPEKSLNAIDGFAIILCSFVATTDSTANIQIIILLDYQHIRYIYLNLFFSYIEKWKESLLATHLYPVFVSMRRYLLLTLYCPVRIPERVEKSSTATVTTDSVPEQFSPAMNTRGQLWQLPSSMCLRSALRWSL